MGCLNICYYITYVCTYVEFFFSVYVLSNAGNDPISLDKMLHQSEPCLATILQPAKNKGPLLCYMCMLGPDNNSQAQKMQWLADSKRACKKTDQALDILLRLS